MMDAFGTLLKEIATAVRLEFHSPMSNAPAISFVDTSAGKDLRATNRGQTIVWTVFAM